jgi:hypothetical protein
MRNLKEDRNKEEMQIKIDYVIHQLTRLVPDD